LADGLETVMAFSIGKLVARCLVGVAASVTLVASASALERPLPSSYAPPQPLVPAEAGFSLETGIFAVGPRDGRSHKTLLEVLAAWLSSEFDLPALDEPPAIAFASARRIASLRFGDMPSARWNAEQPDIVAVYDDEARTIYLPDGWSGKTPSDLSVLVHELVHHLQNRGGLRYECPQAREKLAFEAQQRWLGLYGSDLQTDFELDPLTLLVRTKCLH
jgi:hypothetical protein